MKDLFEGDLIIQSEEFAAQFARRAFGPITGPVLLTRYGFKNMVGSTFTIYRTAISLSNNVSGPIFNIGQELFTNNLGFVTRFGGVNIFPAFQDRTTSANYATMFFDVNRVVKENLFYILMEIEQTDAPSARNSMQFLEIRYLTRPIIEILEALKISGTAP